LEEKPDADLPDCECDKCDPTGGGQIEWGWGSYDPVTGVPRLGCVDTVVKADYARFVHNGTEVVAPTNRFYGSKMFPPKGIGLSEPGYLPEQRADAMCSQQSGLHTVPENLKGVIAEKDEGCPDPCAYSPCNIGQTFTVQCPRHCYHYYGAVRGESGSAGSKGPYADMSSICRSAILAGYGNNDDSFYATFRIVAPMKKYSNLRYENKFMWEWDYAEDPARIAAAGTACCVGGWPPKLGAYNPTARYRQDFKNEWQNVRAYEFVPPENPCGGGCKCPQCRDKCHCDPKKCQGCMMDDCYECPHSEACKDPCADKCKCDPAVCGDSCRKFSVECAPCYDKCKCVPGDCIDCAFGQPQCEPCADPCDCTKGECLGCMKGSPQCLPCKDPCSCTEGECQGCVAGSPQCTPCEDPCNCNPEECAGCQKGEAVCLPCEDPCSCKPGDCLDCIAGTSECSPCEDVCNCVVGSCAGCEAGSPQCLPCEDPCNCDPSQCQGCMAGTAECEPCADKCFCEPGTCQGCEKGTDACAKCIDECNCEPAECPLCKAGQCDVCPDTCQECEDQCDCDPIECTGCIKYAPECTPCKDPCNCNVGDCKDCLVGTAACTPCSDPCECVVGECLDCKAGTAACDPCPDPCSCSVGECKDCAVGTAACAPCKDKCDCVVGECIDCAVGTDQCLPACEDICNCDSATCSGCMVGQPVCDPCPDPCACSVGECKDCAVGTAVCEPCADKCNCAVGECSDCAVGTSECLPPCADPCKCVASECTGCEVGTAACLPECEDKCSCDASTCSGCLQGQKECEECPSGICFSSGSGKSLLNSHCATWRDDRGSKSTYEQMRFMAKCMAQDCVQSLEPHGYSSVGCRFMDANGFCFAYNTAQEWCAGQPGNVYCNDRVGPQSALVPIGSIPDTSDAYFNGWASYYTEWMPMYNVQVDHPEAGDVPYNCTCMKNCGCKATKCWCDERVPNGPFGYDDYWDGVAIDDNTNKNGECACACGGVLGK